MGRTVSLFVVLALLVGTLALAQAPVLAESPAIIEVSQPRQLTTDPRFDRNPSFVKAIDGTWWLFFARGRGDPAAPGYNPENDYYDICYLKSTTSGTSWTEGRLPDTPAGHGQGAYNPAAVQDGLGKIWVFYAANGVGVFYFLSTDNGVTWSGPIAVPNVPGYTVRSHVEALVAKDGKIWLFYEAGPDNAIYGRSFDGVNWSALVWVSYALTDAERPRALQEAVSGTFHVVYSAGSPRGIYLATSTTNGTSWTSSLIADTADGDYDPVLVKDGSTWRLFFMPYVPPFPTDQSWLMTSSSTNLSTWTTPVHVTSGHWAGTTWWDFWPEAVTVPGKLLLFYSSMKDDIQRGDGDIFLFDVNWNLSREHYESIQSAIDGASNGDTINVAAGTYKEDVFINKQVTLNGPNAGINPNTGSRVTEAIIVPVTNNTANGIVATVMQSNVTLDGFTIDGDNTALSGGVSLNGVDANAYSGIANMAIVENVIVRNNIIKNLIRGVNFGAAHIGSSGNRILNNQFDNMPSSSPLGQGIALADSFFAEVSGNYMTRVYIGIHTDDFRVTGTPALINANHIQSYRLGIWHNLHHYAPSPFTIQNNQLTTVPGATGNVGLWLTSIRDAVEVFVTNNNVSGAHTGIQGWNLITTKPITITGGTLDHNSYGVWLYNTSPYPESPGAGGASRLGLNGVTIQSSTIAGLRVQDSPAGGSATTLVVAGGSQVSGSPTGALVEGPAASLLIQASTLSGNGRAVDLNRGTTTILNSFINSNTEGVIAQGDATATVNFNNLSGNSGLTINSTTGVLLDASANWWGSNSQATILGKVGTSVDYTPWLDVGTDTQPATAGFQGDFSVLTVDDNSPQSSGLGRIQEGIDLVSGSLVKIAAGTYNENVTFGAAFNKNNVTVLGDALSWPVINGRVTLEMAGSVSGLTLQNLAINGGMRLNMAGPLNGFTLRNISLKGNGGNNRVIQSTNTGALSNLIMDNCLMDGENVAGRHGFAGNNLTQNLTIANSEFKNILGRAVVDLNINASGDESADLPLETVTFNNNRVHHCNGEVFLRGHATAKTRQVNVYGNLFEYIGNNQATQGDHQAALLVDNALNVQVYNNTVRRVYQGTTGRGDAMQLRRNATVNIHDNFVSNNYAGLYFPGGTYAKSLAGVEIHSNTICGNNQFGLRVEPDNIGTADAEGNWWGTNNTPGSRVQGSADYNPWIMWGINANPASVSPSGSSTISVIYSCPGGYTVPNGHVVNWSTNFGTVNPVSSTTSSGVATTVLTGNGTPGVATVTASDQCNATLQTAVSFSGPTATPTPSGTPPTPTPTPTSTVPVVTETTITIQKGTLGNSEDTYIYQYGSAEGWCWSSTFKVGYGQQYQSLVRFSLSPIPASATIVQAQMKIYSVGWNGSGANINVGAYALLRSVNMCQANWNQAANGNPWGLPGANDTTTDRRPSPESTQTVNGLNKWYTFDLTALVQSWVNGSLPNNGVILRAISGTGYYTFASADGATVSNRPKLVVTYRVGSGPPPPPTATPTSTPPGAPTATPTPTGSPTSGAGTTVILQQGLSGYTGAVDTYIYQYAPDTNYCTDAAFKVGYKQQYAALLRFTLPPELTGKTITAASLQLYATGWGGVNITLGPYAVLRNFSVCEATWNQAQTGVAWGIAGCNDTSTDRRAVPESTLTTNSINKWYSFDVRVLVQSWVNGTLPNNGVLMRAEYSTASFNFASAQWGTATLRPKLIITYY